MNQEDNFHSRSFSQPQQWATLDASCPSRDEHVMRRFAHHNVPRPPEGTLSWNSVDPSLAVDIEIGAGQGLHALAYAKANPNRQLIAIERTTKIEKLLNSPEVMPNLLALRGDAINWITHMVPPASIDRVFILYPNPYPKRKQHNQRWYNMPFMAFLKGRLKSDGTLTLATNRPDYYEEARELMTATWGFKIVDDQSLSPNVEGRSHFEKKYLSRGETCWNLRFRL